MTTAIPSVTTAPQGRRAAFFGLSRRHAHGFTLLLSLGLMSLATLSATGCVGSSEQRRARPEAAYSGPVTELSGPTAPAFIGRFQTGAEGVTFAWSGSEITLHFKGTAASVDLTDTGRNQYLVLVDGKPLRNKVTPPSGRSAVELVSGLPRGEHTVTLYKLTEPLVGEATLHGFILDKYGEALPTPARSERRIEIIGDSISTGYGNEGNDPACGFSPETENHFVTYGARAARELGAELVTLAWSGRGVFSNRGSTTETETMSVLWERTLPSDAKSAFDFKATPPSAVVINLGTNDYAPEVKDTAPFGPAFDALFASVRGRYPEAHIFITLGPLLRDDATRPSYTEAKTILTGLVDKKKAGGDKRVHFFEFGRVRADEGLGCDYHPTEKTHRRMAGELLGVLKAELGW